MNESTLNQMLNGHLKETCKAILIFKHSESISAGVPDNSYTYGGSTSWVEVKYDVDALHDRPLQNLRMKQLARFGKAWYVIFRERKDEGKRTFIVNPKFISPNYDYTVNSIRKAFGFDYELVERYLKELHHNNTMDVFNQLPRDE